jgi:hypothetical protein
MHLLGDATHRCAVAERSGRTFRNCLPAALRLKGNLAWTRGRRRAAERSWRSAIAVAEKPGARFEIVLTNREMAARREPSAGATQTPALTTPESPAM